MSDFEPSILASCTEIHFLKFNYTVQVLKAFPVTGIDVTTSNCDIMHHYQEGQKEASENTFDINNVAAVDMQ